MYRFSAATLALLLTLLAPSAHASAAGLPSKVNSGVYAPTIPVYHANGTLAWHGLRQGADFQPDFVFRHNNGRICWGGMKQLTAEYNYAKEGAFFWDNGQRVWGGYEQYYCSSAFSQKAAFKHRNGALCWGGAGQDRGYWRNDWSYDERMAFHHDNGQVAWGGLVQMELAEHSERAAVYHSNGRLAWSGIQGSPVYDAFGSLVAHSADYVNVTLGDGVNLFVDYTGRHELTMYLGEGYTLRAARRSVYFDFFEMSMEVTP